MLLFSFSSSFAIGAAYTGQSFHPTKIEQYDDRILVHFDGLTCNGSDKWLTLSPSSSAEQINRALTIILMAKALNKKISFKSCTSTNVTMEP